MPDVDTIILEEIITIADKCQNKIIYMDGIMQYKH